MKVKRRSLTILSFILFLGILLGCPIVIRAAIVVNDHFDNSSLDPAWSLSFQNATGWNWSEAGTNLTVTDITTNISNAWAKASLSRSFAPISDFHIDLDFGWDSESDNKAMQYLYLSLLDSTNNAIATAGYGDVWVTSPGARRVWIGSGMYTDPGTLPFSGTALLDIDRTGEDLEVYWDSTKLLSGKTSSLLSKAEIWFGYYPYTVGEGTSFFGTEVVDLIKVESSPVPVPSTILLLGFGLVGLAGLKKKFRKN